MLLNLLFKILLKFENDINFHDLLKVINEFSHLNSSKINKNEQISIS